MAQLFAVFRGRGPQWDNGKPMEEQEDWRAHADFMNALEAEGMVIAGGPLEGSHEVLLAMRGQDEADVRSKLADDPWSVSGLLEIRRIAPWTLRLGGFG